MANSILTPSVITKEALRILHQKLNFIPNINTQYDSQYANSGAKIGNDLKIRLPNEFTTRTGAALSTQDVTETSTTLTVDTQKGVDFTFSSEELTMHIDEFSKRYLEPAMSSLAATMEADALTMIDDVYNMVDVQGSAVTVASVANARKQLVQNLTPAGDWCMIHDPQGNVDLVDATKGLFNAQAEIGKQYKEGAMGKHGGFMHYENTLVPSFTSGTAVEGDTAYNINGASQTGATLVVDTGTTTLKAGDVITIEGVNRVHPETKADTGELQKFVVTADAGATATSLSISPAIVASGGKQNVTGSPADNAAINKLGGGASFTALQSLGFQKDAFAFATADLVLPQGVDMAAREVLDGISMRMIRDYTISDDQFPCRIDVLYGYKAIRPQNAVKIWHNS
jgi:hypothetical protein